MESKHTPGPWQLTATCPALGSHSFTGDHWLVGQFPLGVDKAMIIAQVDGSDRLPNGEMSPTANARLIAAAPDLLDWISALLGCCELNMDDMEPETLEITAEAHEFIAKFK